MHGSVHVRPVSTVGHPEEGSRALDYTAMVIEPSSRRSTSDRPPCCPQWIQRSKRHTHQDQFSGLGGSQPQTNRNPCSVTLGHPTGTHHPSIAPSRSSTVPLTCR